jgi:c-di-GMP-binding flagellar brake protein YcgR
MTEQALKLKSGDILQLQFVDDTSKERSYVRVIGYLPNQSLIVTTPRTNNRAMLIRDGQVFVVRLMSGNSVYGFNASVIRSCSTPYPYLHLTYPKELAHMVVRKAKRVATSIIVSVHNENPDSRYEDSKSAMIQDLSTSGALISADHQLGEANDLVTIAARFKVANLDEYLKIPAMIRNVRKLEVLEDEGQHRYQHGIEFQLVEGHDSLILHSFVHEQLVKELVGE